MEILRSRGRVGIYVLIPFSGNCVTVTFSSARKDNPWQSLCSGPHMSNKLLNPEHPFPMIRSGGLFVSCVGLGIVTGAILGEKYLLVPLIAGAAIAIIAQSVLRSRLARGFGRPTRFQVM